MGKQKRSQRKEIIDVIRTTLRNSIDLTNIADNKANVLLTLNGLMITFLMPLVLSNIEILLELKLILPPLILILTCVITIYMSSMVLKPGDFRAQKAEKLKEGKKFSPFFFGNYDTMTRKEFFPYMQEALSNNEDLNEFLADDLYFIGKRLGEKMTLIKYAYNIFLTGLSMSVVSAIVILLLTMS